MYIGVDLGTSSIKLLLTNKKGVIIDRAKKNYPSIIKEIGYSEQDPNLWLEALIDSLIELNQRNDLKEVKSISFCGQMHGLVILDNNNQVIRPSILWNDNRTIQETSYLNDVIGKTKLLEYTGNIAYPGLTATKLLWLKKHEIDNFNKISKIMLPKDYLVFKLTNIFASDVTDNSGTLYFDVKNKKWSKEMLDILSITQSQLPKIYESVDQVGLVTKEMSDLTGLTTNTKVIIGGGDQAMGAIGTGCISKNYQNNFDESISISLGTSGVVFAPSKQFSPALDGIHSFCHSDGYYHLMGCMLSCAGAVDWWLNTILETNNYKKELKEISNTDIKDLLFLPYLAGERSPINDPKAVGIFYGLNSSHTRQDMTKAVIEGVSLGLKDCLEVMTRDKSKPKYATVIGGGTKSKEWLQLLSNVLNLELRTINTSEGGAYGAIILAMTGDKVFHTIEDACKSLISFTKSYYPSDEQAALYQDKYIKFKELYHKNKE
jgi:xylulokinase